jgi:hypothetical protein
MSAWQPIETAPENGEALFWIRARTPDEQWRMEASDKPIDMGNTPPRHHMGRNRSWSSLMIGTHWMPLPLPPSDATPAAKDAPFDSFERRDRLNDRMWEEGK